MYLKKKSIRLYVNEQQRNVAFRGKKINGSLLVTNMQDGVHDVKHFHAFPAYPSKEYRAGC